MFAFVFATVIQMMSFTVAASAGPDYPWSCRDARAVMAAARRYSSKTPSYNWDESKMWQAYKEYAQCFRDAADAEDRFDSLRGTSYVLSSVAYVEYTYTADTNILSKATLAERKRFFQEMRRRALRDFHGAKQLATDALNLAHDNDVDADDFESWAQHNIDDRIAEVGALSFQKLKSYSELTGASVVPRRTARGAKCENPNIEATTMNAVAPNTPPYAQQQGITGVVNVVVQLDTNSKIVGTPTVQSSPSDLLNDAAIEATEQSTFRTEIKNCHAVSATYIFAVEFNNN